MKNSEIKNPNYPNYSPSTRNNSEFFSEFGMTIRIYYSLALKANGNNSEIRMGGWIPLKKGVKMGIYIPPSEFPNFWSAGCERKLADPQAGTCFPAQKSALLSTRHIHKTILQGKIGHRCRNVTTFMTPRTLSGPCQSLSDMTEKGGFLAHFLR